MTTAALRIKRGVPVSWSAAEVLKVMRTMQWFFPHVLFAVLLALVFTPGADDSTPKGAFLAVLAISEAALLLNRKSRPLNDVMTILYLLFIVWEIGTTKVDSVNLILYPSPAKVFAIFASDWQKILDGIRSSMYLLGVGFTAALTLGVLLGIVTGSVARLRDSLLPLAKVISPIPPIIYTPYAVAVLPTFEIASIFVIFSSIFWQIYIQVALSVSGIDQKLLDSAKTMNLSATAMFFHVLWPYCLPNIMKTLPLSVANAFMVLTAAEMIGATSGLGYFVRYYADFADYTRVIAGIFLIGIVVSSLNYGIAELERKVVRWH
ncbi:MAG: ABC transporter permease subunit [Schwartzia sp.]|nr:ABC transporter permease subunit [Schwartzia sp. (in: firmicutes)]MBP3690526.1 ABC transporter permease subunit [Schwartzia sp. (in: firmicutes)]